MELKPGKLLKVSYTNSKFSLTTFSGESSTSDGLRIFLRKSSGKRPTSHQLRKREFIAEMEIEGYRWQDLEDIAQNRTRWRTVVSGLCTTKVKTYGTKQNKMEDCRQWPMHHQGATGVKQKQKFTSIHIVNTNLKL